MAHKNLAHAKAGTIEQKPDVYRVPSSHYYDEKRWKAEMDKVFRRMPLMLAMSAEIREPGDYKAMDAGKTPVLIVRTDSGRVKAFVNMCSHRGAQVMEAGKGNTHRFTCPYHAWSYNREGELIGILSNKDFGDIDKSCYGLTELPCLERAGLIWVTTDPKSTLDISTFLSGYDELLAHFGFESWHHFDSQIVPGPNWKIAYDGYMDLYHLPILHKDTFGADFPNKALYYKWGPHQRVSGPDATLSAYEDLPEAEWPTEHLISGVWTIFPHVSIAGFDSGGRAVMISQLFPGDTPETSFTIQNYVMEKAPNEEEAAAAREQFKFLRYVVEEEDYATGIKQQHALRTGAKDHILFGRNEGGGHDFHQWVDTLLETADEDLEKLFTTG
jgi:phenylpropionate dioxygenase-like ring-hydroxylating dioxygenase large terminal subunit|tara:strand:+ start:9169 stop:10323 length:1155 start_codon:yes stop_codon:yes gene_type:complete